MAAEHNGELPALVRRHVMRTGSTRADDLLSDRPLSRGRSVTVVPATAAMLDTGSHRLIARSD